MVADADVVDTVEALPAKNWLWQPCIHTKKYRKEW
jgi:hypothetical protein